MEGALRNSAFSSAKSVRLAMHDSLLKFDAFWKVQKTIWRSSVGVARKILLSALFVVLMIVTYIPAIPMFLVETFYR